MSDSKDLAVIIDRIEGAELLVPSDMYPVRFDIPSSNGKKAYTVALCGKGVNKGNWSCSCVGWIVHRNCKHLKAMRPALLMIEDKTKDSF